MHHQLLSETVQHNAGVVEQHKEVVKLSAIVSVECSILAATSIEPLYGAGSVCIYQVWDIIEDISTNCLNIIPRVLCSQRFIANWVNWAFPLQQEGDLNEKKITIKICWCE